ncbi:MAG: ATP F0F1 synthase subunit B [Alphaproteobacteria bacterium]|nr:ATP F0F1 synthase subunit B [Alphaproteobacteria bacterium]
MADGEGHVAIVVDGSLNPDGHVVWYMESEFWVGMAIITFFLLMVWKKIPAMLGRMLDGKIDEIAAQLDNAQTLRVEASALLAKYQKDQCNAEKLAADMIVQAEAEAKLLAREAADRIAEMTRRRTALATQKIAQAESNALKEIHQAAIHIATTAARDLIAANMKKADYDALILSGIDALDPKEPADATTRH